MRNRRTIKVATDLSWRLASILFFILVAIVLVVYARGYRIDFVDKKLITTGAISLEGNLKDIKITLDKNYVGDRLPYVINDLVPGQNYRVIITKNGYQPWEEDVYVESEKITEFGPIRLFAFKAQAKSSDQVNKTSLCDNNRPSKADSLILDSGEIRTSSRLITRISAQVTDACWFNDNSHVAYVTGKDLRVVEVKSSNDYLIYSADEEIRQVAVSSNNNSIYFSTISGKWYQIGLAD